MTGMATAKNKIGSFEGLYVDSRGRLGDLALLWDKSVQVTVLSCSFHHMDVIVMGLGGKKLWQFTGLCCWHDTTQKLNYM